MFPTKITQTSMKLKEMMTNEINKAPLRTTAAATATVAEVPEFKLIIGVQSIQGPSGSIKQCMY